jgi:two-component system sensor kinase FixL
MWGMSADNNKMDTRVADIHQRDSRSATVVAARYALAGAAYLAVYAVLDRISLVHGFQGLGISLWTPAVGFTMAVLLTRGFAFAPLFLVAVVFTDVYVHALPRSVSSIMVTGAIVTLGYSGLVWVLQRALGFDLRQARLRDIVILMVAVPTGIMVISFSYCAALYLMGLLPADQFWNAVGHFWVGDTVGTVIVLPAMMAGFASVKEGRVRFDGSVIDTAAFLLGLAGAFAMIFGPERTNELQFFYLLFLPVMWIAIRVGFVGAALGLLATQVMLVVIAKFENIYVEDFMAFQMLMLALSAAGLLLGAMVTERREAEDRLREQQAELSRMSRYATAGAMGLSVAHQISQPLSTVATYLHAAARLFRSDRSDPIAIVAALEKAEAEAERAREVLERIRDFLSRGRLELTPVDLVRLVSRIAPTARAEAATRGVQIKIEGVSGITVKADPIQIEQVLLNLIANAIDSAAERPDNRGVVTVRIARYETVASVQVDDNGSGIAPEIAERLLEPFETTKPRGMGLGLPLSRQIIEAHGGRLVWTALEPQGTRFMFELSIGGPKHHDA